MKPSVMPAAPVLAVALVLTAITACDRPAGPSLTAVWPATPAVGGELWVSGSGFGTSVGSVRFGDRVTTTGYVLAWSDDAVRVLIPPGTIGGRVTVVTADERQAVSDHDVDFVAELVVGPLVRVDGTSTYEIVAMALDAEGMPVQGVPVTFLSDTSSTTPAEAFTGPDGTATSTIDLGGRTGLTEVRVSAVGRWGSVAVYDMGEEEQAPAGAPVTGSSAP